MGTEANSTKKGPGCAEVLPLDQLIAEPWLEPASVDAMAAQMNNMMWANMMWNASLGMDQKVGNPVASVPPFRNRRKARSLVSQAQEAQRLRSEQHLRTMMGITPERNHAPGMTQHTQPRALSIGLASATECGPEAHGATSKAQFCPSCGGKVLQHFKFCRYCGLDVELAMGSMR